MTPRPVATAPPAPAADFRFPVSLAGAVERCWRKAAAPAEWNLTRDQFAAALRRSVAHRFLGATGPPEPKAIEDYLEALHHGDLALACACSAGGEAAWDAFVAQFRQDLYRAARAIADESSARELADSLYADLYGLRESEGRRKSLFDYFHGRSKLGTWLRAVLAQRHVDAIRRARKFEPLEDETGREHPEVAASTSAGSHAAADPPDPDRAKYLSLVQAALAAALDLLEPGDRLRLAYYYADELTLAEIGRLLGEHEATVSRKLDRARRDLRQRIEAALRDGKKLSAAQIQLCYDYACKKWPLDLTLSLRPASANPAHARRSGVVSSDD
jgi:RNA polymerase sigma-70 factor (ECF subfamily)